MEDIPLSEISTFKNHPFKVKADDELKRLKKASGNPTYRFPDASLAACGGQSTSESSTPAGSSTTSDNSQNEEARVYGIGEAAETDGLSITIDKAAVAEPNIMIQKAEEGCEYIKVWVAFKNVSDETIESPSSNYLYIVHTQGEISFKKSNDNSLLCLV